MRKNAHTKNATICIKEMRESHRGNQHSVNYVSNAVALFERQRSQYVQRIKLKYIESTLVT